MLREMVARLGMSRKLGLATLTRTVGSPLLGTMQEERLCSEDTAREIDEEVRERLSELYEAAKRLLEKQRGALSAAAEALLARETLTGEEVAQIAAAHPQRAVVSSTA
jgi:cell division protease FtsH